MKKVSSSMYQVVRNKWLRITLSKGFILKSVATKGFTLIELIVVMAIISILASLLVVNFSDVNKRGRDSERKSDIQAMRTALELYRADEGSYPCDSPALPQTAGAFVSTKDSTIEYMKKVPKDPRTKGDYYYQGEDPDSDGICSTYMLIACLENKNDTDENIDATKASVGSCSTTQQATYVVTNP